MEFNKIEALLEKYFEGETSISEETELKSYFSSTDVPEHLEHHQPLFGYFAVAKEQKFDNTVVLISKKRKVAWLSLAASVVVLLGIGIGSYTFLNRNTEQKTQELGTYNDPKKALEETQKALALISEHVNTGIESAAYINEYEQSKNKIFK